jgi:hypothetical protein
VAMASVASTGPHRWWWGWKSLLQVDLEWWCSPSLGSFLRLEACVAMVHAGKP